MDYTKLCDYYPVERETLSVFLDKINRVKRSWEPVFTDFISPAEQIVLKEICDHEGLYTHALGGIGYFERAVCSVSRDEYTGDFPVDVIKITGNFKFEKVTHRDYLGGVLSLGIKREKLGDINVFEDGLESRDFVYIDDIVQATFLSVMSNDLEQISFNVGTEHPVNVLTIAETLIKSYNSKVKINISGNYRVGDIRHNYADINLISSKLGYKPKIEFEQGIKLFCKWVEKQNIVEDRLEPTIEELKSKGLFK
jgi:RNA-binding protein YlmH